MNKRILTLTALLTVSLTSQASWVPTFFAAKPVEKTQSFYEFATKGNNLFHKAAPKPASFLDTARAFAGRHSTAAFGLIEKNYQCALAVTAAIAATYAVVYGIAHWKSLLGVNNKPEESI